MRYKIQAIPMDGLGTYFRCGRPWPRGGSFVDVEVVANGDADPKGTLPTEGEVLMVGETEFGILQADSQLRISVAGPVPVKAKAPFPNQIITPGTPKKAQKQPKVE